MFICVTIQLSTQYVVIQNYLLRKEISEKEKLNLFVLFRKKKSQTLNIENVSYCLIEQWNKKLLDICTAYSANYYFTPRLFFVKVHL
jgi:low affinity Fe/Cu permease